MIKTYFLSLIAKEPTCVDTITIKLDRVQSDFNFIAGQYISITLPGLNEFPVTDQYHDFSISSSPNIKDYISTTMRVSESQFKTHLMQLDLGTKLRIDGPKGVFTLPTDGSTDFTLIAGGVGITPFMSLINFSKEQKLTRKIKLLYFNNDLKHAAYLNDLNNLARDYDYLEFYPIFGLVNEQYLQTHINNQNTYYIAGPPKMVDIVRDILKKHNVKDINIKTESFTGY